MGFMKEVPFNDLNNADINDLIEYEQSLWDERDRVKKILQFKMLEHNEIKKND